MTDQGLEAYQPPKLPDVKHIGFEDVKAALGAGWADFKKAPLLGIVFGGFYALGGIAIWAGLMIYQMPWMIIPLAIGFPLIGPFVAVGLYEISRRLIAGKPLVWREIFLVMLGQRERQLGWMAFVLLFIFWMWIYQVRMLMAIFLGSLSFSTITGFVSVVTTTSNGLGFLLVGSIVGGLFAFCLFSATVVAMPLLMEREFDFVSAIVLSFKAVRENFLPMLAFAAIVGGLTLLAMLPAFLGLIVVLPLLGHATWHLYLRLIAQDEGLAKNPAS